MSTFEVKMRRIDVLEAHPNADRLECVVIGGYRAVVQKGVHTVGDYILYIPEDSVFKDRTIAERLNVAAYLTGKYKNRVKAVKLRGVLSQGIVVPWKIVDEVIASLGFGYYSRASVEGGIDFQEELQIEKYEEPIPIEMMGHVRPWPSFLKHYDVENIKRPESLAAMIEGEEVVMTEKLHGTNFTIAVGPGLNEPEELVYVCSRRMALKESETNVYWRAVHKYGLVAKVRAMLSDLQISAEWDVEHGFRDPITSVAIHGEVVGVQDLKYGYVNGDIGFYAFDISVNGKFVDHDFFVDECNQYDIPRVPELYRGPYNYNTLNTLAHGKTEVAGGHIREGGVVRPVQERQDIHGNRVQFKFVSEDYLTRKGGTELH